MLFRYYLLNALWYCVLELHIKYKLLNTFAAVHTLQSTGKDQYVVHVVSHVQQQKNESNILSNTYDYDTSTVRLRFRIDTRGCATMRTDRSVLSLLLFLRLLFLLLWMDV